MLKGPKFSSQSRRSAQVSKRSVESVRVGPSQCCMMDNGAPLKSCFSSDISLENICHCCSQVQCSGRSVDFVRPHMNNCIRLPASNRKPATQIRRSTLVIYANSVKMTAGETCTPGKVKVGFCGMGIMGVPMAKNLVKSGYEVVVWNRSLDKCAPLIEMGATKAATPAALAEQCDVVFAMVSDPQAALEVATGPDGVAAGLSPGKGYVDASTVDAATSRAIHAAVKAKGGLFLEAPVSGSKGPAENGQLIFLTGGDQQLFDYVQHPLSVMGKASLFLGEVGKGAEMKLVVNSIMGSMMGAFCEGMALADKAGLSQADLLSVLDLGAMANPMFKLKGPAIQNRTYPPAFPLKHQQKDMRLALALGEELQQSMPIAAAANETYKKAKAAGKGDDDFAAIYEATISK